MVCTPTELLEWRMSRSIHSTRYEIGAARPRQKGKRKSAPIRVTINKKGMKMKSLIFF